MRLDPGSSDHIEDRRGMRMGGPRLGGGLGIGAILLILAISWLTGSDPRALIGVMENQADRTASPEVETGQAITDQAGIGARDAITDIQNTWTEILGPEYRPATMVLFEDATVSGCGYAQSATGPFYCPADQKLYIDLSFYDELHRRFGAPGDFAQAYVLAHEVGHHVQTLMGVERQVRRAQQENPRRANELSVLMELQADCLAGVWGHSAAGRQKLDPGDVEEGLAAAAAIGDDRMQRQAGGRVSPESFTHGTSAQRQEWLKRGLTSGKVESCDTFRSL